ncbi:multidrug resistance-associated ABC transporter [Mycena maculata]|uniref:Multidrug resistance-associated ABC transporter n=1 Tax=Mycena maculata TaxID=230809 RepID=A0AAD7J041_9AGAR|nr:multidrug resistance-associated ABC transporter [Mycena maculata]
MSNWWRPQPAPPAFGKDDIVPDTHASAISRLFYEWLSPFLSVGFSRPLQKDDLWQLPPDRLTEFLSDQFERTYYARFPFEERPLYLQSAPLESGKHDRSFLWAMHTIFGFRWWAPGIARLFSDTLRTTSPLVTKALLAWLTESWDQSTGGAKPPGIGFGIGLSFALFAMQEIASLINNQYQLAAMTSGLLIRTSAIGAIFRKSLRLSGRARALHSTGQITTLISTDAARLDNSALYFHSVWIGPIQVILGIALLISVLGYSALVGFGVLILGMPFQSMLLRRMFRQRGAGVKITDQRVRFTNEVLQSIRLIKYYAWEAIYAHRLGSIRAEEVMRIRSVAVARACLIAFVMLIPVLAPILSFVTYSLSGHTLSVPVIFSALQLFAVIRPPLIMLPLALNNCSDALVSLKRISAFLRAEELSDAWTTDLEAEDAVQMDGTFKWESAKAAPPSQLKKKKRFFQLRKKPESKLPISSETASAMLEKGDTADTEKTEVDSDDTGKHSQTEAVPDLKKDKSEGETEETPFELRDVTFRVPRGAFVAVVGSIGSGKSSLLNALIGEMRRTTGNVVFGGSVAYVSQSAWIMNATLRENIEFGRERDDAKFARVIHACALEQDLEMLPNGEATEIGEKGINLSGGQKARVSLARAIYAGADIILCDDTFSAVDAHTANVLLERCFLAGPNANCTRVLVTHALQVLDRTDYIYVMDEGKIVEQGTFTDLRTKGQLFSHLIDEFGALQKEEQDELELQTEEQEAVAASEKKPEALKTQKAQMSTEERLTGAVLGEVYLKYFRFAGSVLWAPALILLSAMVQGAAVGNNVFLGLWTENSIPNFTQGQYMGVYAALGIAQATLAFVMSFAFSLISLAAGLGMFKAALNGVIYSPTSFFDSTPMGRIISRLSKDQDTVDNDLAWTTYLLMSSLMSVLGTVALVFYTFPPLGAIFAPLGLFYYLFSSYYRRTSVETKRLDSLMRSALYASYNETLTGLATVRAFGEQARFIKTAGAGLDMENRAYYMTIGIQRWLSVRLDLLGNLLLLGIGIFASGERHSINPAKVGVVLSYSLGITQIFSDMVSTYAQNEQNMNAVERIIVYTELPEEGARTTPNDPPASWPSAGAISFRNVELSYREDLPTVLKGVTFDVRAGEKVGIVGRTGAGKSSLLQALFRMVEVGSGTIEIDGMDISRIGLASLREKLALVPQDSTLFLGTLRENIDPSNTSTDAELIAALQRAWLLPRAGVVDTAAEAKFGLNASVTDEGANYSAGEKQLLSFCRALVKNSRIIVLDEATSNVDADTDAKIQTTIRSEFSTSTVLCIAHRLNTIAYCDRILVMDAGLVAEFDAPLDLFDREGSIFRSLCDEAGLSRLDIVRMRTNGESAN